jgi:hypothetical protein
VQDPSASPSADAPSIGTCRPRCLNRASLQAGDEAAAMFLELDWKIGGMTLTVSYQEGSLNLPSAARARAASGGVDA